MHALKHYFRSRSGYVLPSRTLSLGTAVVALVLIAIVGGLQPAFADDCYDAGLGEYDWECHFDRPDCPTPGAPYCDYIRYYHSPTMGCLEVDWACCDCPS